MNVAELSDSGLRAICNWMNRTPRKCLDYKTPEEVAREEAVAA